MAFKYLIINFDIIYKCFLIMLGSMIKFLTGPITGSAFKLPIYLTFVFTILGMMMSVMLVLTLGNWLKINLISKFLKPQKRFSPKNRRIIKVWKKFGIVGVAGLTPLVFTPLVGTFVALSFGVEARKIFVYMLISAIAWALICIPIVYYFRSFIPI